MDHRTFFNSLAPTWDEISHHDSSRLAEVLDHLELFPGCIVLDAGCGTGIFSEFIVAHCDFPLSLLCMDISEEMLLCSRKRLSHNRNIHFLQGDLSMPGLAGKCLDRVICYSCFPHVKGKSMALINIEPVLKDDGLLVIAHADNYRKINEFHARCSEPIRNDYLPCPEEMKMLFENACLGSISIIDEPHLYIASARPQRRTFLPLHRI
jgi:ubiquinone/menaquinone biosynthesis C-methylase UbiE